MKISKILFMTPAIALVVPNLMNAQGPIEDAIVIQNVTIDLKVTTTGPALVDKDKRGIIIKNGPLVFQNAFSETKRGVDLFTIEKGSQMNEVSLKNKDILQDLLEKDMIPDDVISGWSIQYVSSYFSEDGDYTEDGTFRLFKSGQEPVDLSGYLFVESSVEGEPAEAFN